MSRFYNQTIMQLLVIIVLVTDVAYSPDDRKGKRKMDEVQDTYIDTDAYDDIKILESFPMIMELIKENELLEKSIKDGVGSSSSLKKPSSKEQCIADILTAFGKRNDWESCFQYAFLELVEDDIIFKDAKGYFKYLWELVEPGKVLSPTDFCSNFGFDDEQCNQIENDFGDNTVGAIENVFRFSSASLKDDSRKVYMQHVYECCVVKGVQRSPIEYCEFVYGK